MDLALPTKTQVSCILPLLVLPITSYCDLYCKAGPANSDRNIHMLPLTKEQLLIESGYTRIKYCLH